MSLLLQSKPKEATSGGQIRVEGGYPQAAQLSGEASRNITNKQDSKEERHIELGNDWILMKGNSSSRLFYVMSLQCGVKVTTLIHY